MGQEDKKTTTESTEKKVEALERRIAELEDENKKLKHRVIKKGKVAVDESALKEMFGFIWQQKLYRMNKKWAVATYERLFDVPGERPGKALTNWIFGDER